MSVLNREAIINVSVPHADGWTLLIIYRPKRRDWYDGNCDYFLNEKSAASQERVRRIMAAPIWDLVVDHDVLGQMRAYRTDPSGQE